MKFTKDNLRNTFSAVFSLQQVDNINKLYNYLHDTLKWSDRNIAAALGNAMQESGFRYDQVSSANAKGAFQFLGDRQKDYDKWRKANGYADGALSLATYLNYIITNKIDPRMDMVINARKLLLNKNHTDSINANKVLNWAEPSIKNGTFYPISDLSDAWGDDTMSLEDLTTLWSNTIEKAASNEKNNALRVNYAKGFHNIITSKRQGGYFKEGSSIYIKERNKGKFTKSAKAAGESVQEHAYKVMNDPNATTLLKQRANFAWVAKHKFHHNGGGVLNYLNFFN